MKNQGSALLIIALAVVILLMAGAAYFVIETPVKPGGETARSLVFIVGCARTPVGLNATLTVKNQGSSELRDIRISEARIGPMSPVSPPPYKVGNLPAGGVTVLSIPFTGPAPAANAEVLLLLQYDSREGLFTRGGGATGVSTVLP